MKPQDATHYSKKMNAYFHFDNGTFIWCDLANEWKEFLNIGKIEDLEEVWTTQSTILL